MASKTFHLNTEPHVATIGGLELRFEPEVIGSRFASALSAVQDAQLKPGVEPTGEQLTAALSSLHAFVTSFLMPESVADFEAANLPDRVVTELVTWLTELYGGGPGNDQSTS